MTTQLIVDKALPAGTQIEQYTVGAVRFSNGESTVYEAVDANGRSVWLREFLPQNMVERDSDSLDLCPKDEVQTVYKYSMAAFEELFKLLKSGCEQKLEYIMPVEDLLYAHNTVYVVKPAMALKSLKDEAEERGEPYSWMECKKRILPLMNSLSQLHDKGIVHLGIAPENLYVTEDDHLILAGFSTLEARTSDGELDQQLYDGFSSPEQYEGGDWKGGSHSDVYSLGAVLYWMLTGRIPQAANARVENDELLPANEVNEAVPENVSDAISGALMLDTMLRSATMDDVTSALLESVSGNTTVYEVPDVLPNENTYHLETPVEEKKTKPKKTLLKVLMGTLGFILLVLALGYGAYRLVTDRVFEQNQPEEDPSATEEVLTCIVPDFVGHQFQDIMNNASYRENLVLNAVTQYSNRYPKGVIMEQSVVKGTEVPAMTTIILTVSRGEESISMPNLIGWGLAGAEQQLKDAGIAYQVYVVENKNYTANTVFRTDPAAETQISLSGNTVVKVYVTPPESTSSKSVKGEK